MAGTGVRGIVEFTQSERDALCAEVEFKNERVYHAPQAEFAGLSWDIVLDVVEGRVSRVSALVVSQNREQQDRMWRSVDAQIRVPLGTPAREASAIIVWDTKDGNVVMNRAENDGEFSIALTLTSRRVAGFAPLKRTPKDYKTLTKIGSAYGKLGQYDQAVAYFKKAITLYPSYAPAYLGLGTSYGYLKQPDQAILALRGAVALDPGNPYAHAKLGTTLSKAGRYEAAAAELGEALRLKPDLADAHFALGLCYISLGKRQQAQSEIDVLLGLSPEYAKQLQMLLNQAR